MNIPKPPPLPRITYQRSQRNPNPRRSSSCLVPKETVETWDKLFKEGTGGDTNVQTEDKYHLLAHSCILAAASPVMAHLLDQSRDQNGIATLKFSTAPYQVVNVFLRFLYSSCYEEEDLNKYAKPLMMLSHCYSVPSLKRVCEEALLNQNGENNVVLDMLQLARSCDATRMCFLCISMVIRDFDSISHTEAWKALKEADPLLERELEAVVEAQAEMEDRRIKLVEKKTYLEVYEALEALVHIYREGCVTIGPRDKALKGSRGGTVCKFRGCRGVERELRHFLRCESRALCLCCKKMRQLLLLHACVCDDDDDSCEVPLCRSLKEKISKKGESIWTLLAEQVISAKNSLGPFSASLFALG